MSVYFRAALLIWVCAACSSEATRVEVRGALAFGLFAEDAADEILVQVRAPGRPEIERVFPAGPGSSEVELEIAPGSQLRFTITGRRHSTQGPLPVFWGERVVDILPGFNEIELVLDPAGVAVVAVVDEDGVPIKGAPTLRFVPTETAGFAVAREVVAIGGRARVPLIVSKYVVSGFDESAVEPTIRVNEGEATLLVWCGKTGDCDDVDPPFDSPFPVERCTEDCPVPEPPDECVGTDCPLLNPPDECVGTDCPLLEPPDECVGTDCPLLEPPDECVGTDCPILDPPEECTARDCLPPPDMPRP